VGVALAQQQPTVMALLDWMLLDLSVVRLCSNALEVAAAYKAEPLGLVGRQSVVLAGVTLLGRLPLPTLHLVVEVVAVLVLVVLAVMALCM